MVNETVYERQTNCSEIVMTSSSLLRAQRVHRTGRICVHANEYASAWPDPPTQWRIQDLREGVSKFVQKAHVAAV